MRQRIAVISLLLVWLFQSTFTTAVYEAGRINCRMVNFSNPGNAIHIEQLCFASSNDVHWEVLNKEFILNNWVYDVLYVSTTDSGLVITCFKDKKESDIVKHFNKQNKDKQKEKKFKKTVINFWCETATDLPAPNTPLKLITEPSIRLYPSDKDIPSPPPKIIV